MSNYDQARLAYNATVEGYNAALDRHLGAQKTVARAFAQAQKAKEAFDKAEAQLKAAGAAFNKAAKAARREYKAEEDAAKAARREAKKTEEALAKAKVTLESGQAEAGGIAEKANAMKTLEGKGWEYEEALKAAKAALAAYVATQS